MTGYAEQSDRQAEQKTAPSVSKRWAVVLLSLLFIMLPLLLAILAAVRITGGGASAGQWLPKALLSRGVVKYAIISTVLAAMLCVTCHMMWRIGARARTRQRSQDGGAIIEFALVLPFAMSILLMLAQASFLMVGHLCVQYSAYCAARTAIVAIPDDYGGEVQNYMDIDPDSSAKHRRILESAVWAVMPVSCSTPDQPEAQEPELIKGIDDFFTAYGESTPGWVQANLQRKWKYAEDHTFVDVSPPISGDVYGEAEDITVSVRHTFYLSVPVARTIFAALDDGVDLDLGVGEYGLIMRATCTLTNEGVQDYVEEEIFPRDE